MLMRRDTTQHMCFTGVTIKNADGVTLGDIREQAGKCVGKAGLLLGESEGTGHWAKRDIFVTEEQAAWVEDGHGRDTRDEEDTAPSC